MKLDFWHVRWLFSLVIGLVLCVGVGAAQAQSDINITTALLNAENDPSKNTSPSSSAIPQDAGPPAPPESPPTKPEFEIYGFAML